ncbi:MAG: alpha-galactosidase [Methylacidiphilales bacterium]|nr:alpha-galactosidase [Candidatus Methylacidiphilales bacterium]
MFFPPDPWQSSQPPFSFKYDGKESSTLLSSWQKSQESVPSEGGQLERKTFTDPATGLKVTAEVRTFRDYDAVEWVLKFSNQGKTDTPILEDIEPLASSLPVTTAAQVVVHSVQGSSASQTDFEPQIQPLGQNGSVKLGSSGGRSSNGMLPFFDLQVDQHGVIGAIGWTGNWSAEFSRNHEGNTVSLSAGMQKTHLVLHPGEEIRTPRILLLNWSGDRDEAHNIWRRLLLAYYTPQEKGQPLVGPACYLTWGNALLGNKLARAQELVQKQIPFDVYWIDAGWYGNEDYTEGSTVHDTPWWRNRGNWWPNKPCYPDGFKPLSALLHQKGIDFLLWFEPEQADPGTALLTEHPEWFLKRKDGGGLLNLGDPEARKGITDLVSDLITQGGVDWYRQDFNIAPDSFWVDPPDRIGMTEIRYIEGLYAFWDDLRARHPGLKIDNCASGGRRLDLETISRSMALWRSDYSCFQSNATGPQLQTLGLAPWVPLSAGCCEGNDTYSLRSAYSPGLVIDSDCNMIIPKDDAWLKAGLEEFHQARPFFYGDFYPLLSFSPLSNYWSAMQFDRPDLKAGLAMFFRRADSPFSSIEAHLRKIDPAATYSVEIRTELGTGPIQTISGKQLIDLPITLPTKPGSALVFYARRSP